jgi:hypothetical protein
MAFSSLMSRAARSMAIVMSKSMFNGVTAAKSYLSLQMKQGS